MHYASNVRILQTQEIKRGNAQVITLITIIFKINHTTYSKQT